MKAVHFKMFVLYVLMFLLLINTIFLYPFSTFRSVVEPVVIFGAIIWGIFLVISHNLASEVLAKRHFLRVAFAVFLLLFVASVGRRIFEFMNDYVYFFSYMNTVLYLLIVIVILGIAFSVYREKVA